MIVHFKFLVFALPIQNKVHEINRKSVKFMRWIFCVLLSLCVFSTCVAQDDSPNTLVLNQLNGERVEIDVNDIDSITVSGTGADRMMNMRRKNHALRTYVVDELDFMGFEYVKPELHQAVDLGLSVMWATCNLGAEAPEEYGLLFSWGEIRRKWNYTEDKYNYFKNEQYVFIGDDIAGTKYDAATANWGIEWRMPTIEEVNELLNRCDWTPDTVNLIPGYRVTGYNNNSIFLPAAGYQNDRKRHEEGEQGFYWTSTLNPDLTSAAYNLNFKGYAQQWSASRAYGFSIRPVRQ